MIDPYRVLELPINASSEDIHTAYRDLARRYHPDRNGDTEAPARMIELNEAYSWLKDDDRRRKYDRQFIVREPESFQRVVIEAALDRIRSAGGAVEEIEAGLMILDPGGVRVGIDTVGVLGEVEFDRISARFCRQWSAVRLGYAVVLAYRVVAAPGFRSRRPPDCPPGGVVDLVRSEWFGEDPVPCPEALGPLLAT
jgi:curved DNA-binding protein CbpA